MKILANHGLFTFDTVNLSEKNMASITLLIIKREAEANIIQAILYQKLKEG